MTDQEKLARQWAKYYLENWTDIQINGKPSERFKEAKAAVEFILDHTEPETMADVEWDDEKHRGMGATAPGGETYVMYSMGRLVNCFTLDLRAAGLRAEDLTPNGKRYELREVGEPEHPATLKTQADYENAPVGTVVAEPGWPAWTRTFSGKWINGGSLCDSGSMSGTKRDVLRWGWDA